MGVVTTAAPQFPLGSDGTTAQRQLFRMRDDFEAGLPGWQIDAENLLQRHARPKIANRLSRIRDTSHAGQMTLFANAVALSILQFGWVDDVALARLPNMSGAVAVTTRAADSGFLNRRISI
jgi:hypothetical protein